MKKNIKYSGFSLVELLVTLVVSATLLVVVNNYYKQSNYNADAVSISGQTLYMLDNIKSWNQGKEDCKNITTPNVLASGLAPSKWSIGPGTGSILERVLAMKYKYGRLLIRSNLRPLWLSGSGLRPVDGYSIVFETFPRNNVPKFIELLKSEFDLIDVGGIIIKDENGMNQTNYNTVLNMETGVVTIALVTWGC